MEFNFVLFFSFTCGLFMQSIKATATCKYEASYIRLEDQTIQIYGCKLKVDKSSKLVNIQGQHINSKSDSEVEAINKVSGSILTQLPSTFCDKFENLQVIVFSGAEIKKIDENSFKKCKNLKILNLFRNKITEIPDELFAGNSQLTRLCLSSNKLENLPLDVFSNLKNLKTLELSQNEFSSLDPNWFEGLHSLQTLDLKLNRISELPPSVFKALENLEILNLASNNLQKIDSDSFGSHPKLQIVNFMNNKISEIAREFIENVAVKELDMENNFCFNKKLTEKNAMMDDLKTCFGNYKPRKFQVSAIDDTEVIEKCNRKVQKDINKLRLQYKNCFGGNFDAKDSSVKVECGKAKTGLSPWYAYIIIEENLFLCSGTLISSRHVVTVAHCIQEKLEQSPRTPNDLFVLLGKPRTESHRIDKIDVHPDWNPNAESFDADIAILTLDKDVVFNDYIQPICLMDQYSELASITDGIVLAYPTVDDASTMNTPKMFKTPIHSQEYCFLTIPELSKFSSARTFCGGYANGTEFCRGNSGATFSISNDDIHYLRGMASSVLFDEYECVEKSFTVYTNILKHSDWIDSIILSNQQGIESGNRSISITSISVDGFINEIVKTIKTVKTFDTDAVNIKCPFEVVLMKHQVNEKREKCLASQKSILKYGITSQNQCGKPKILRGTIIGGHRLVQGSFPWIAALMQNDSFICGGTIISNKKVVTAAHCVLTANVDNRLKPEHAKVLLGMHNLKDKNEIGRVEAMVKRIVPHHHWNPRTPSYDADIAVLELENEIQFTVHIQPICLISPDAAQEDITKGYVVGYGKSEDRTRIHEDTPKIIETPIMGFNNCSDTFSDIQSLLSNRMFCGGYANGTGTCTGDSGSGLYVEHDKTYYLRGVVSSSLYNYLNECNVNKPSAFTDAVDFYIFMTTGKAGSRKPV